MDLNFIKDYTNVIYDANSQPMLDYLDIREYIFDVIKQLEIRLANRFNDYFFIVFSRNSPERIPHSVDYQFPGKKKILLYLLDEEGLTIDELANKYDHIFKQYLPIESKSNIYPFPLGHVNGVNIVDSKIKPTEGRYFNVFFSGSLNKNRTDFFNQFSSLRIPSTKTVTKIIKVSFIRKRGHYIKKLLTKYNKKTLLPNSYIKITEGFKKGLSTEEYIKYLLNSKIALCPSGASCVETYRHFEAMSAGCIIISDQLPKTSLYEGSPIIQVNHWKEGINIAIQLLKSPAKLGELQNATIRFWKTHYAPTSVADYIIAKIGSDIKNSLPKNSLQSSAIQNKKNR